MAEFQIRQFPCFTDNYGVLLHDPASGATASIDAPEEGPVEQALKQTGWKLTHILVTHHHADHVGGIPALKARWGCEVVGHSFDAPRIPGLDTPVEPGSTYSFAGRQARIFATPGHTAGHITWHFPDDRLAFAGDTLFVMGCGRVFEGAFAQMWDSLSKLKALDPKTSVYCGHEYTQTNARFALTVDPDNGALKTRAKEVEKLRADGKPTVPTTIAAELKTNPFLRPDDPAIRKHLRMEKASDAEVFTAIRKRKDSF